MNKIGLGHDLVLIADYQVREHIVVDFPYLSDPDKLNKVVDVKDSAYAYVRKSKRARQSNKPKVKKMRNKC